MVNQKNTNLVTELTSLHDKEAPTTKAFRPEKRRTRKSRSKNIPINDELIVSLSDAYENKRARQVTEWERMRRQNVQPAL